MKLTEFNYNLPQNQIAQLPLEKRQDSRMLVLERHGRLISKLRFQNLPRILPDKTVLVVNSSRVYPARLFGQRATGGKVELLFTSPVDSANSKSKSNTSKWEVLLGGGSKIKDGEYLENLPFNLKVLEKSSGTAIVEVDKGAEETLEILNHEGEIPLPPYIHRKTKHDKHEGNDADPSFNTIKPIDRSRYQTVYADTGFSSAAPTAGLHFTPEIISDIEERGVPIVPIILNVGPGTFLPVKTDEIKDHKMHAETGEITKEAAEQINDLVASGYKILAVGTTVVRTLESQGPVLKPGAFQTDIFIYPGYRFKMVDHLLTNFHQPQSTLLMLVQAFAGQRLIKRGYKTARKSGFRFLSYGDCMLIL